MALSLGTVKIIPFFRRYAKGAEDKGKELRKKYKWVNSIEFFGVTFFVLLPLWGTGSFIASLVGKLINMNDWRIFIAVVIGSILRISLAIAVVTGVIAIF